MSPTLQLNSLNKISASEFQHIFSNVIECRPQAAAAVSSLRPFRDGRQLVQEFQNYLSNIDDATKERILQLYPDLAGKLACEKKLTTESTEEHASAGLDLLSTEQHLKLTEMNEKYKRKFGFPFVICVRETNKIEAILREIKVRVQNGGKEELNTGIEEVKKICRLRIGQILDGCIVSK